MADTAAIITAIGAAAAAVLGPVVTLVIGLRRQVRGLHHKVDVAQSRQDAVQQILAKYVVRNADRIAEMEEISTKLGKLVLHNHEGRGGQ